MKRTKPIFIALSVVLLASVASARQIKVGPGNRNDFNTIQAAINAAHPGDNINVQPGTYAEQLVFGPGKNNITLETDRAVIAPPPSMVAGFLVTINTAKNVTVSGFTISGPLPDVAFSGSADAGGIEVEGAGSAVISNNYLTQMWQATASNRGVQNGIAILVGRQSDATTGSAAILNNKIDHWQKGAIVVDNNGSDGLIANNNLIGEGPINYTAQNGIQVGDGATALIRNNDVRNLSYTPATFLSSGILIFDTTNVVVSDNNITACDLGVAFADVNNSSILRNNISKGMYGIDVDEFSTGSRNNLVALNQSNKNSQEGIFVSLDSVSNVIILNDFRHNAFLDAEDDSVGSETAGTGNFWSFNQIGTDNHGGHLN
jgi:hypothetical protein